MHHCVTRSSRRPVRVALALALMVPLITSRASAQPGATPDLLVYHQITDLGDETVGVGGPEISADGTRIVFTDAPGSGDPALPNRILVIDADGAGLTEVDSYQPKCFCASLVDISADGSTVLSTEGLQLRIADAGGARELLSIGEIGAIRLSASGDTAFFLVRRDTSTADGGILVPRGVWAIDAIGDNLRQIVSAEDIADLFDITIEETGCCFYGDGMPFDVSATGDEIVFGAYAIGEYVLGVNGDGGNLHQLAGPYLYVKNVAISGDGSTVAFDIVPPDNSNNKVGLVDFAGGEPQGIMTATGSGFDDILHLSDDGSSLLLTPISYLVDTATGDMRQLAVLTPGAPGQTSLLADGMVRASMNADATRFVYVMNSIRCADCANQHEQLGTLDIAPTGLGAAPILTAPTIDPDEIANDSVDVTTTSVAVESEGEIIAVGVVALLDGIYDINIGYGAILLDDGLTPDAHANDDIFTNGTLYYTPVIARPDDTGPRTLRYQAEIETPDGLHHATALDAGTLTVVVAP
jgi:hypothetical protein